MFGIGGSELVVIVFVVLLIFGPGKIPEIARVVKRAYQEWAKVRGQVDTTISEIKQEIDLKAQLEDIAPAVRQDSAAASRSRGSSADAYLSVPEADDYLTEGKGEPDRAGQQEPADHDPGEQAG